MKMYVTKHVLSGDSVIPLKECELIAWDNRYATIYGDFSSLKIGRDAHHSAADALKDAERRRAAKIASLEKQIAKLHSLTFTVEG